jgi:hypothetical protein
VSRRSELHVTVNAPPQSGGSSLVPVTKNRPRIGTHTWMVHQ